MSVQTLTKAVRGLSPKERVRLFDRLRPTLEDYLLTKIADDRFKRNAGQKRIPWVNLKP